MGNEGFCNLYLKIAKPYINKRLKGEVYV